MGSFSALGIGLSFVFGCILLGIVAELYYLLWWKKRINNKKIANQCTNNSTEISSLFCWKKPRTHQELTASVRNFEVNGYENDVELGGKDGKDDNSMQFKGEEGVESELKRLHNLCGPPRFLFTIKEETKEDLVESEDGKSRKGSRTRSLSDIIIAVDTPFLTPLASPPLKTPQSLDSYSNIHGFNPLFDKSITESELNMLRSYPPPKFKFLRDAEEKLIRRLVEEAEKRASKNKGCAQDSVVKEEIDGSFIAFIGKSKEKIELHQKQQQSSSLCYPTPSRVLPVASSPSTFR